MTSLQKPLRADRLVEKEERKKARRSSPVRNQSGAVLPKPEVWHNAKYRAWAVSRNECGIRGKNGHVCGPRFDRQLSKAPVHPEPFAKGIKASDNEIVVLCDWAHAEQHSIGWQSFQKKYDFDRDAMARRIFESSPWFGKVEVVF